MAEHEHCQCAERLREISHRFYVRIWRMLDDLDNEHRRFSRADVYRVCNDFRREVAGSVDGTWGVNALVGPAAGATEVTRDG